MEKQNYRIYLSTKLFDMVHRSDAELNLDMIVFEERNQAYGAFTLRSAYNAHLKDAFFWVTGICLLVLCLYYAVHGPVKQGSYFDNITDPHVIEKLDLEFAEKPKVKSKPKPTPPRMKANPGASKSAGFVVSKDSSTSQVDTLVSSNDFPEPGTGADAPGEGADGTSSENPGGEGEAEPGIDPGKIFVYVDEMPSFPGGEKALASYVIKNLRFPFVDANVAGKVFVQFTVSPDGKVKDVQLLKGIHPSFDDEAMRVISNMPQWNPGKYRGRSVPVKKVIPILFHVQE